MSVIPNPSQNRGDALLLVLWLVLAEPCLPVMLVNQSSNRFGGKSELFPPNRLLLEQSYECSVSAYY
jgi:hypothetical protein